MISDILIFSPKKAQNAQKKKNYSLPEFLRLLRLFGANSSSFFRLRLRRAASSVPLFLLIGLLACPCLFAAPKSINARIMANLGGINITGLPKIVFPNNNTPELSRIGFACSVTHKTSVSIGGSCRTEWQITGLRTRLYFDHDQNLIWARPNLAVETLYKHLDYSDKSGRFTAKIQPGSVEIRQANGQHWSYVDGFLKSIYEPSLGSVEFETDKEIVLRATLVSPTGRSRQLLKIEYSDSGLLKSITAGQRPPVVFVWSGENDLVQIRNLGSKDYDIAYTEGLISGWRCSDGKTENYAWSERSNVKRDSDLGRATLRLKEDANFLYEYWKAGGLDYVVVRDKAKNLVSKTRISNRGVIQYAPTGGLKALYRINHNGAWQLVEPQDRNLGEMSGASERRSLIEPE